MKPTALEVKAVLRCIYKSRPNSLVGALSCAPAPVTSSVSGRVYDHLAI